ncbi:MAG TPA: DsrE family protein [Verrucomicrobiae bacterium]|jgi:sulfur relay (sulfurtransferase) complex TusBCD TusD component (DsrE family)
MVLASKKLGLLLSSAPDKPGFRHGLALAETALRNGVQVYMYCIDEAVLGLENPTLQSLQRQGVNLFACAYGAQKRNIAINELATFAGLSVLSDLVSATDRFVCF